MSIWQFIKNWRMGSRQKNKKYHFILSNPFPIKPENPATQENRKNFDVDFPAVSSSLELQQGELYRNWILLSPREQDVTALTCLRFTNPQIAAQSLEIRKSGSLGSGHCLSGRSMPSSPRSCHRKPGRSPPHALNLIKQEKTAKADIRAKHLQAGWNNDYLLAILRS